MKAEFSLKGNRAIWNSIKENTIFKCYFYVAFPTNSALMSFIIFLSVDACDEISITGTRILT